MTNIDAERRVEEDWWAKPIPDNVQWGDGFYCETAQVFRHCKARHPNAVVIGEHVSVYAGCSFALGVNGRCEVGDFTLLNGALIMAEEHVSIGSHCLISWNVGIADSDFHPIDAGLRQMDTRALAPFLNPRPERPKIGVAPVVIKDNVWIGMNAIILKGVVIGENSVVGAGSVVTKSVEPNCVVAGNPAVLVKRL